MTNTTTPNKVEFSWSALTKEEQDIFEILATANVAMTAMDIYYKLAFQTIQAYSDYVKNPKAKELYDKYRDEKHQRKSFKKKLTRRDAEKLLKEFRKLGVPIPVFTTILKILEDVSSVDWVQKRFAVTGRASALYYLTDGVKSQINEGKLH